VLPIEESFRLLHSFSESDGISISCIFLIGFGLGLFVPELFDDLGDFKTLGDFEPDFRGLFCTVL